MAQYKVKYCCGHEGYVNLTGTNKQREQKLRYLEYNYCPDCYAKQKEEENKIALERSKEMELPSLTGTEKQVAWANTIRIQAIESIEKWLKELEKKAEDVSPELKEKAKNTLEEIYEIYEYGLKSFTDSEFWIEKRNYAGKELLTVFKREYTNKSDIN